ncbi:coproporphyrinogen III oxidase [Tenuifilaceae bacterium CYCD]|nr:coproporphyrinogen III oxidase [Tenuifilaceae bacterium CYCD]
MSGIYIHVPFCHKKCAYCDFYSVGKNELSYDFPKLIVRELELRRDYLEDKNIETIYFGGGTPSLLPVTYIEEILNAIKKNFSVSTNPEITLEANPDDLCLELLKDYKIAGVNRISIGVQSFIDEELRFLGRRHDSLKAVDSIAQIKAVGFSNISLDLIYGLPNSTMESWEFSLNKAIDLDVQHLSCYHLTYEESTPITRKLKKGQINAINEELSIQQYDLLRQKTQGAGFIHYEISNFAKQGFISRHNSSYWRNVPYLGVGPSAHSFNINTRQWNPNSIVLWSNGIKENKCEFQSETIDETNKFNELLLTRLRTIWGVDLNYIANGFSEKYINHIRKTSEKHFKTGNLILENFTIKIPAEKFMISDSVMEDLFFTE